MKVLVTGLHGYIGMVLGPILQKHGHNVSGLDRSVFRSSFKIESSQGIPCTIKDLLDVTHKDLEGYDAICHLAGLPNDPYEIIDSEMRYKIACNASVRLAKLARDVGIGHFIFSSSCSSYGAGGDGMLTEQSPCRPLTAYAKSKLKAERKIAILANNKFSPVFLRIATVYGVSPQHRFDLILNNMVAHAIVNGKIIGIGNNWRPMVHVEDVARAFVAVLESKSDLVHNEIFNVGVTSENFKLKDIAEIVCQVIPDSEFILGAQNISDNRNYRINCDKLPGRIPVYRPEWNVRKGICELYHEYKKNMSFQIMLKQCSW